MGYGLWVLVVHAIWCMVWWIVVERWFGVVESCSGGIIVSCCSLSFFFFPDFWYGYYVMMVVDASCDCFCGCGSGDLFLVGGWWRYYVEVASFDHEGDVW